MITLCCSLLVLSALHPGPITPEAPTPVLQAQKLITLNAPGWSLKRICAAISTQLGQTVEPHGDCVTDYLIVHVHNVPWPELMKKLAWVEYGQWTQDGSTLTLQQVQKQIDAQRQLNQQELLSRLKDQLEKDKSNQPILLSPADLAKQLQAKAAAIRKSQQYESMRPEDISTVTLQMAAQQMWQQVPLHAGIKEVVESFSPQELASIPADERVVYSNHPTSLQRPFPDAAAAALANLVGRQNSFVKALNSYGFSAKTLIGPTGLREISDEDTINISFRNQGFGVEGHLRIFDKDGVETADSIATVGFPQFQPEANSNPNTSAHLVDIDLLHQQEWHSLQDATSYPPSTEFMAKLHKPESFDPLSISIDPLTTIFPTGTNTIIHCDPLMIVPVFLAQTNHFSVEPDALATYASRMQMNVDQSDNWVAIRVGQLARMSASLNRSAYSEFTQGVASDGTVAFEPAMRFCAQCGDSGFISMQMARSFFQALCRGQSPLTVDEASWDLFRLVGSLEKGELSTAETSSGFILRNMGDESIKVFKKILLGKFLDNTPLQLSDGTLYTGATIHGEPTYEFAHSLPPALLKISFVQEKVITYRYTSPQMSTPFTQDLNPAEFGNALNEFSNDPNHGSEFKNLRLAPQLVATITLEFPGTQIPTHAAKFVSRAFSPKVYASWHDLPDEIKKQIESTMKHN